MSLIKELFGKHHNQNIYKFTLQNTNGMSVALTNFGATIISINVPDKSGEVADVICGYDDLQSYIDADGYQGAIIGRVGNRICKGKFVLDDVEYNMYINNGPNHLHGGKIGFDKRVWQVLSTSDCEEPSIKFFLLSKDGEENYPGNLAVTVTYTLNNDGELVIKYEATTDKRTIINLTNHTYFNLGGYNSGKIFDHELWLDANTYLPTDETLIPTGEIRSVEGTPFDFRLPKTIGRDFNTHNQDLIYAGGYDHCFNFMGGETEIPKLRAKVYHEKSGRTMEMYTNQPCVQFYTGNFLTNSKFPFKNNCSQEKQMAFCLETQHMPDSINHPYFTNVILNPEEKYNYTTIYKFYTK